MTIEIFLKTIQDMRAFVEQWGVTAETLIAVAAVASILFLFSLREVLSWYLRVYALRDDVKSLRKDIAELKALMRERPLVVEREIAAMDSDLISTSSSHGPASVASNSDSSDDSEPKKKVPEKPSKNFPLAH